MISQPYPEIRWAKLFTPTVGNPVVGPSLTAASPAGTIEILLMFSYCLLGLGCGLQPADIGWPTGNGKKARAKPVAWPSCAWLQLTFFPFPVGNPKSAGCT